MAKSNKNYGKQLVLGGRAIGMSLSNVPSYLLNSIKKPVNDVEIAVMAQRRSGHHAIVNWMRYNMEVPSIFINNCYSTANPLKFNSEMNQVIPPSKEEMPIERKEKIQNKENRSCLIYNFEDQRLSYIKYFQTKINRVAWLGKSQKYYKVIIIRDPFNLLASKLKWARGQENAPSLNNLFFVRNQWKQYAKFYLANYKKQEEIICIDYNSWFTNEAKRKEYANRLDLMSHEEGVKKVAQYGPTKWGDSFDGLKYENKAQEMKVLERWKIFQTDEFYLKLIKDEELIRLAKAIYSDFSLVNEAIDFANNI